MSDYHLIKPFYACFIYFLESVPPIYPSGVIFGPHSCLVSAPAADSGQTKRMFGGRSLPWRQKETGDKDDADSQGVFSKWSFIFLAHIFLHSATPPSPPPARLHPVVHRSTFNSPKIYIFHLHHLLYVFFFINTTNTDRWANSANLEILWNCYVMRLLCFRILVLHWFIAVLPLNSTSLLSSSHSPMFDVEFCFSQAETRPKRREKVTAKTFLWLYVATPERSANSPLSLPVVQRRFNKVFNHRPIRLGVVEEWAGTAERQQQSSLLAKLWNINANFYKNSFSFLSFFSFFTWIKTSETKCEHFLLSPPRVTATEAFS